jgi:hypothetical protein
MDEIRTAREKFDSWKMMRRMKLMMKREMET